MIGVTLTTFNRPRFTEQCLKSFIWSNPDKNMKMVIVDNASEEKTRNIVGKYAERYSSLIEKVIFNKENLGLGKAINQGWNYLEDACDILGAVSNDFLFEPGWDRNIISCFLELNADYVISLIRPGKIRRRILTPSGKGFYNNDVNDPNGGGFILTKWVLKGIVPSSRPFSKGYFGPNLSFHKKIRASKIKRVRLCSPGILHRVPEYNEPELVKYYDKTFRDRGYTQILNRRKDWERHGRRCKDCNCNWNEFLKKWYPKKFKKEKSDLQKES